MRRIVLASTNRGKIEEIKAILAPMGWEITSLNAYPGFPEIEEHGATFEENAVHKARLTASFTREIAMADDSGLEVDYLAGAPGVFSARFAGEPANDTANNNKLLKLLEGMPYAKRTARFRCVIAVATPEGKILTTEGKCEGYILTEPRGTSGFGYDPLFYYPENQQTFAEMQPEDKNRVSHRARALAKIRAALADFV